MKKMLITAAGLLLTTSAFASTITVDSNATFKTDAYSSQAEAYQAGFELADSFKAMDQGELKFQLPVQSYSRVSNVSVNDSEITIQEFATNSGNVEYHAIVDLGYQFDSKDN